MEAKAVLNCRGCLSKVDQKDYYSFMWQEIKDLFIECTAIKIPPDEFGLPQQICSECYTKCEQWYSFKTMCQEVNEHLQANNPEPELLLEEPIIRIKQEVLDDGYPDYSEYSVLPENLESYTFGELIEDEKPVQPKISKQEQAPPESNKECQCPVCDLIMPESRRLQDHLKEHYMEESPRCPICDEYFTRASKVYPHVMSSHMGGNGKKKQAEPRKATTGGHGESFKECPVCKEHTPQLLRHLKKEHMKHGDKVCPVCQETKADLYRHLIVHTDERPYPCGICDMTFTMLGNRNRHWQKHHKKRNTVTVKSKHAGRRKPPVVPVDVSKMEAKCPVCRKLFTSAAGLHKHFVMHTDEQPFSCKYCKLSSRYRSSIRLHIRRRHSNKSCLNGILMKKNSIFRSPRPWEKMGYFDVSCRKGGKEDESCPEESDGESSRQGEDEVSSKQGEKDDDNHELICQECGREFDCRSKLLIHSVVHTGETPYQCVYCPAQFTQKGNGLKHMQKMHPKKSLVNALVVKKDTQFAADLVQYKSGMVVGGIKRANSTENTNQPFQCSICEVRFKRSSYLRVHMKNFHPDKKPRSWKTNQPFQCTICQVRFKKNIYLRVHLKKFHLKEKEEKPDPIKRRIKTEPGVGNVGNRLFPCPHCDKSYLRKGALNRHMTNHDSVKDERLSADGADNLQCSECAVVCTTLAGLTRHMRKHGTGDLPFQCKPCKMGFSNQATLRKHRQLRCASIAR